MRIWDVPPEVLCRQHLLGEHRELHSLWTVISQHKKGYSKHPETKRWVGKLAALYQRHDVLVGEMQKRGYQHHSPLAAIHATGDAVQTVFINSLQEQLVILKNKPCICLLEAGVVEK